MHDPVQINSSIFSTASASKSWHHLGQQEKIVIVALLAKKSQCLSIAASTAVAYSFLFQVPAQNRASQMS